MFNLFSCLGVQKVMTFYQREYKKICLIFLNIIVFGKAWRFYQKGHKTKLYLFEYSPPPKKKPKEKHK